MRPESPYSARRAFVSHDDPTADIMQQMLGEMRDLRGSLEKRESPPRDEVSVPRWVVGLWGALCTAALLAAGSAFLTVRIIENDYVTESEMMQMRRSIELGDPVLGAQREINALRSRIQRLEQFHDLDRRGDGG